MIEMIMERFNSGEYSTPNGARLFIHDMEELQESIDKLKTTIDELENTIDDLEDKMAEDDN